MQQIEFISDAVNVYSIILLLGVCLSNNLEVCVVCVVM